MCPGNDGLVACSGHGNCKETVCECSQGFRGLNCAERECFLINQTMHEHLNCQNHLDCFFLAGKGGEGVLFPV
jgi:hypothetical protein